MSAHRIKLPHRFVQLGDVFQTREGALFVVSIDRGGRGHEPCCIIAGGDDVPPAKLLGLELETLASLHATEVPEAEPLTARLAAE